MKSFVNLVSLGATVMKYNQSPAAGFSVALMASVLGLAIGVGGKPANLYVL